MQQEKDPKLTDIVVPPRRRRLRKVLRIALLTVVVAGVGIQFIPVEGVGVNPSERFAMDAPPEVQAILRRACMDCHSNETHWPLYSRIAPGSWLMAYDVKKGRSRMNFSEWGDADEDERAIDKENSWEQIESGAMPPWFYIYPFHLDAKLSDADKALLKSWLLAKQEAKEDDKGEKDDEAEQAEENEPAKEE